MSLTINTSNPFISLKHYINNMIKKDNQLVEGWGWFVDIESVPKDEFKQTNKKYKYFQKQKPYIRSLNSVKEIPSIRSLKSVSNLQYYSNNNLNYNTFESSDAFDSYEVCNKTQRQYERQNQRQYDRQNLKIYNKKILFKLITDTSPIYCLIGVIYIYILYQLIN
jgi:uncharacterized protein YqhQ